MKQFDNILSPFTSNFWDITLSYYRPEGGSFNINHHGALRKVGSQQVMEGKKKTAWWDEEKQKMVYIIDDIGMGISEFGKY